MKTVAVIAALAVAGLYTYKKYYLPSQKQKIHTTLEKTHSIEHKNTRHFEPLEPPQIPFLKKTKIGKPLLLTHQVMK